MESTVFYNRPKFEIELTPNGKNCLFRVPCDAYKRTVGKVGDPAEAPRLEFEFKQFDDIRELRDACSRFLMHNVTRPIK